MCGFATLTIESLDLKTGLRVTCDHGRP